MFAIVMAGGSGTRFWPASRADLPKQFLKITGERTMLEETIARVSPLVDASSIYVVVGPAHAEIARALLGETPARVVVEPYARSTAACIGFAALYALRERPDEPVAVLPADHFVAQPDEFVETLRAAAELARRDAIVTLGVRPTRPETGYGYLEIGQEQEQVLDRTAQRVERFVEKPDPETALRYVTSGRYRWNSGIFLFTPRTILREIAACLPALGAGLQRVGDALGSRDEASVVEAVFRDLESISIDHGVMERTSTPIYALDAEFGWSDVGSWEALYELRAPEQADGDANLLLCANAAAVDARRTLVYSTSGRAIALLGVEDLVVADTPDALLVADIRRSQEVKRVLERLGEQGKADRAGSETGGGTGGTP